MLKTAFDKIQHIFIFKVLEISHLNIIKAIYSKLIAAIPLKSGKRQGCLLSLLLFNKVLKHLARTIRKLKETNGVQIV